MFELEVKKEKFTELSNFLKTEKSPYISELNGRLNKVLASLESVTTSSNPISVLDGIDSDLLLLDNYPED